MFLGGRRFGGFLFYLIFCSINNGLHFGWSIKKQQNVQFYSSTLASLAAMKPCFQLQLNLKCSMFRKPVEFQLKVALRDFQSS